MAYTFSPYDVLQVLRKGDWLDFSTIRTQEEAEIAIRYVMNDGRDFGQNASFRIACPGCARDTIKLEKPPTAAQEAAHDITAELAGKLKFVQNYCPVNVQDEIHALLTRYDAERTPATTDAVHEIYFGRYSGRNIYNPQRVRALAKPDNKRVAERTIKRILDSED